MYLRKNLLYPKGECYPGRVGPLEEALAREGVDVLRIILYTKENDELMPANIDWAVFTVPMYAKHLVLHLDDTSTR